jgi:hypothetical protein
VYHRSRLFLKDPNSGDYSIAERPIETIKQREKECRVVDPSAGCTVEGVRNGYRMGRAQEDLFMAFSATSRPGDIVLHYPDNGLAFTSNALKYCSLANCEKSLAR